VSTFGLEPELFLLTTGTFNLVVKDRIAFRLSGAYSVQNESLLCGRRRLARGTAHQCESVCPRNLIKLSFRRCYCQPIVPTGFPPVLHSLGSSTRLYQQALKRLFRRDFIPEESACKRLSFRGDFIPEESACKRLSFRGDFIPEESAFQAGSSFARNRTHSSAPQPVLFGTSRRGRLFAWEKTLWRFLRRTLKPFEEPCPRMQTSWPRPISGFNLFYLMPDERREIQLKRPASHTTALDDSLLYH
jgi:hypothetical protein